MAGPGPDPLPSGAMDIAAAVPGAGTPEPEIIADQISLGRRLRQPRTILSLVLPIVLLVLFVRSLPGFNLSELPAKIRSRFNSQLDGQSVVAWSEFDVDATNHYAPQVAVLTEDRLIVVRDSASAPD